MKNSKRFLSLTLAALAASCVDSDDKALLRGQASTNKIHRHRQLKKEKPPDKCGINQNCCEAKHKGTVYHHCDSGEYSCNDENVCESGSPAPGATIMCVPVDTYGSKPTNEDACDADAAGTIINTTEGIPCYSEGDTCGDEAAELVGSCQSCVKNCTTHPKPQNDEFRCEGLCHPSDPQCCMINMFGDTVCLWTF